LQYICLGSWQ